MTAFPFTVMAVALVGLALSGCGTMLRRSPTPTLIPTLALIIPPTPTVTFSPTPAPDTATPPPTEPFTPSPSATITITPWVPDTSTPGPSPTITRTPTVTRTATRTRVPTRTRTITLTPTITNTPTPPAPILNIVRPGLLSRVLSPIKMEIYATVGENGKIAIELIGEDGRLIAQEVKTFGRDEAGKNVWLIPEMPFQIDAAAETARLQVVTTDQYGRAQGVGSVDLVLLGVGRNEIYPPSIIQEPYLIRRPRPEAEVTGGLLVIQALANPVNDSPLFIELVNEENALIAMQQVEVAMPTYPLSHTPFTVEIPYEVDGPTHVRLIIRQEGSRIPGNVALISQLITLLP